MEPELVKDVFISRLNIPALSTPDGWTGLYELVCHARCSSLVLVLTVYSQDHKSTGLMVLHASFDQAAKAQDQVLIEGTSVLRCGRCIQ